MCKRTVDAVDLDDAGCCAGCAPVVARREAAAAERRAQARRRTRSASNAQMRDQIAADYESGLSLAEVAARNHRSVTTVRHHLMAASVQTRPSGPRTGPKGAA